MDASPKFWVYSGEELIAMPAITVDDTLVLPRIPRPDPAVGSKAFSSTCKIPTAV